MQSLKLIVTSKANLKAKYPGKFSAIEGLFSSLIKADKKRDIKTAVVYIDDKASAKKFRIKAVASITEKNCKTAFDALYLANKPAYMVIFGAQDVFPFQSLENELFDPDNDSDELIASDLPYACESPYSKKAASFTNPARVVGRIPDIPKKADLDYLKSVINDSIKQKELSGEEYQDYFAVTAHVWLKSSQESIKNIFGSNTKLLDCPPDGTGYTKKQLSPLTHFYNCHGAEFDPNYYGQKGSSFPVSLNAVKDLDSKVSYGTVVAAECCYGAQLMDPSEAGISIANNYLLNHALSLMGSSTISYGPPAGQGLADLICQYYIINLLAGASAGRALLEARQKFLNVSAPDLDAHELKTLAQFYILGDPSLTFVKIQAPSDGSNTIENRRNNLFKKGISLGREIEASRKVKGKPKSPHQRELGSILKDHGFSTHDKQIVFETAKVGAARPNGMKKFLGGQVRFRTFQKAKKRHDGIPNIEVLVIKENRDQVLGSRVYVSR